MLLKAIAIALVVPPISLLFVTLLGLLLHRRLPRLGLVMAWLGGLGLLILALPIVSGSLLTALELDLPLTSPPDQPPQAIVILGGDILRTSRRTPHADPGPMSLERVRTGARLARETGLPVLITGGEVFESDPPVATIMADSLQHDFQVPVQWVEDASPDTWENAHLSAPILREHGIRSIYLITNAWHMRRALLAFADTGLTVTAAPTRFDREPTGIVRDFVPNVSAWRDSFFALHEWIGCAVYAVRARWLTAAKR